MGRYEDAIAAFRRAHERHTARWAFVGRAAARIMLGEYEEADKLFRTCARVFPPVVGATTHVYAGEALRRRGALAEAVDELTIAVETKAGRVGAWLNLALAHHALGDEASVIPIRDALDEKVPGLFWDATRAAGLTPSTRVELEHLPVVYEAALTMMRGNRSSHLITYFDSDGVMRIARDARAWRTTVRKHLSFVSRALESAIASGCAR